MLTRRQISQISGSIYFAGTLNYNTRDVIIMSMHRQCFRGLLLVSALGLSGLATLTPAPAEAAFLHRTFTFSVGPYTSGAPVSPVQGSFTLAWDNSVTVLDSTAGLTLNNLNFPLSLTLMYSYDPVNDRMFVGGQPLGAANVDATLGDISILFSDVSTTPWVTSSLYGAPPFSVYFASGGSVTATDGPEPGSLALFGLSLLGVGIARRHIRPAR